MQRGIEKNLRGTVMSERKYFFNEAEELVSYLEAKLDNPTPLKIQKSLYFLWSFYAATYGSIDYSQQNDFSGISKYPKRLFPATFEAWKYGPVLNNGCAKNKHKNVKHDFKKAPKDKMEKDVWVFIDDLISQINPVNDFGLVTRSHQDKAWQSAYKEGKLHSKIKEEDIIRDYKEYVEEQSQ